MRAMMKTTVNPVVNNVGHKTARSLQRHSQLFRATGALVRTTSVGPTSGNAMTMALRSDGNQSTSEPSICSSFVESVSLSVLPCFWGSVCRMMAYVCK